MQIGRLNNLTVLEVTPQAVLLDGAEFGEIPLALALAPKECREGQTINVFLYYDASEQLVATTDRPYIMVGEFAWLEVLGVTDSGAFLDWGLDKDLFLPAREFSQSVQKGQGVIVFAFLDNRGRITASMREDDFFDKTPGDYFVGQKVSLLITRQSDLGFNAIINHRHAGVIYQNEIFSPVETGDRRIGYIKKVREDSKIDLSLTPAGFEAAGDIGEQIISLLARVGGFLAINDKSTPEEISDLLGVSKKKYKMAVGGLLKQGRITFEKEGIRLVK